MVKKWVRKCNGGRMKPGVCVRLFVVNNDLVTKVDKKMRIEVFRWQRFQTNFRKFLQPVKNGVECERDWNFRSRWKGKSSTSFPLQDP